MLFLSHDNLSRSVAFKNQVQNVNFDRFQSIISLYQKMEKNIRFLSVMFQLKFELAKYEKAIFKC